MHRVILVVLLAAGCATPAASVPEPAAALSPQSERRSFNPTMNGKPVIRGISYGPFREGHAPGGPFPSREQILEDLKIIAPRWSMIRIYGARGIAEDVLAVVRENKLPVLVMLGMWLEPGEDYDIDAEVEEGIRLANAYPDVVFAVNVGNESQVDWSAHRTPQDILLAKLRQVRKAVKQPVTTADDYNFWNKPHSQTVAKEVDFLLLHAYAMWNGKSLENAVPWTAKTVGEIQALHPTLKIVIGETGWATELDPEGSEVQHIKAPAGEQEQIRFYQEFVAWADQAQVPYFYFEAFDEPWKGSANPREVEKHWGLYNVDRTPKPAAQ